MFPWPSNPFFLIPLLFCFPIFLAFLGVCVCVFPSFSKDFRGSAKRKDPCLFSGVPLLISQKKPRVGGSGFRIILRKQWLLLIVVLPSDVLFPFRQTLRASHGGGPTPKSLIAVHFGSVSVRFGFFWVRLGSVSGPFRVRSGVLLGSGWGRGEGLL